MVGVKVDHGAPDHHICPECVSVPGPWWVAHEQPERPADEWVLWSWICDACMMHLAAAANTQPEMTAVTYTAGCREVAGPVRCLEVARAWRSENGYRAL